MFWGKSGGFCNNTYFGQRFIKIFGDENLDFRDDNLDFLPILMPDGSDLKKALKI